MANFTEFFSIRKLKRAFLDNGVSRLYVKPLAPNDNSKNQIYLGGDFEVLNVVPFGQIVADQSRTSSKRDRFKASVSLSWLTSEGGLFKAPNAQLILYPKYPEVRLSAFLSNCACAPSSILSGRSESRLLFLGVTHEGEIVAHATSSENPMISELDLSDKQKIGVLFEIAIGAAESKEDDRLQILSVLRNVSSSGWLNSVRLDRDGSPIECRAPQCIGYTLEAYLGIKPNGYGEPDYLGWEVKAHTVRDLKRPSSGGPITLMTPEPTSGFYKERGVEDFVEKYGYPDKRGRPNRRNFGGIHRAGQITNATGLEAKVVGFKQDSGKIEDVNGGFLLIDNAGNVAAAWSFSSLLSLWNRKHAKAVFVPAIKRQSPRRQYRYGEIVELGIGTDFIHFLNALISGSIYLDPAVKVVRHTSGRIETKRRNQFRIRANQIPTLYKEFEVHDLQFEN